MAGTALLTRLDGAEDTVTLLIDSGMGLSTLCTAKVIVS